MRDHSDSLGNLFAVDFWPFDAVTMRKDPTNILRRLTSSEESYSSCVNFYCGKTEKLYISSVYSCERQN